MANTKNLLGQKFGKLTVESPSEKEGTRFMWNTVCDCGGTKKVWTSNLTRGKITSCGCSKKPDLIGKKVYIWYYSERSRKSQTSK